jgi:hypothetical protein
MEQRQSVPHLRNSCGLHDRLEVHVNDPDFVQPMAGGSAGLALARPRRRQRFEGERTKVLVHPLRPCLDVLAAVTHRTFRPCTH